MLTQMPSAPESNSTSTRQVSFRRRSRSTVTVNPRSPAVCHQSRSVPRRSSPEEPHLVRWFQCRCSRIKYVDVFLAPTAPVFTPAAKKYNPNAPDWVAPEVHEFFPQTYNTASTVSVDLLGVVSSHMQLFKVCISPKDPFLNYHFSTQTHLSVSWSTPYQSFHVSSMEHYPYLLHNDYEPIQAVGAKAEMPPSPYHQQYSLEYQHTSPLQQGTQYQDWHNFFLSQQDMYQNVKYITLRLRFRRRLCFTLFCRTHGDS